MHMGIVFGPDVSLGKIHYGDLFSDLCSGTTLVFPLQNSTTDIPQKTKCSFWSPVQKEGYLIVLLYSLVERDFAISLNSDFQ